MSGILKAGATAPWRGLIGTGGIGSGLFFTLEGNQTLGRNESRPARMLDSRDYCKLHIIAHYVAVLMGANGASGFHVLPVGRIGDDSGGRSLIEEMRAAGMDTRRVGVAPDRPTTLSVCFQYPDGCGGNITASDSASSAVTPQDIDDAAGLLNSPRSGYIALAVPEVPLAARFQLLRRAGEWGALRVANFTSSEMEDAIAAGIFESVDLLAINEDELAALIGCALRPDGLEEALRLCATTLLARQPRMRIVVTAGRQGAFAFDGGRWNHRPALPETPVSTAGAGDALIAGVMCALCTGAPLIDDEPDRTTLAGAPLETALDFGVLLAAYKITSRHTIHPAADLDSLLEFAASRGVVFSGPLADALPARSNKPWTKPLAR